MRWSPSGFEPTSVSRVAPDWDLSDALLTELQSRVLGIQETKEMLTDEIRQRMS